MNLEIERKFEVTVTDFKNLAKKHEVIHIDQGYLILQDGFHTRVRLSVTNEEVRATLCSKVGSGMIREEFEEEISLDHARVLLNKSLKVIHKQRLRIPHKGLIWDVDYFFNDNLAVGEIELPSPNAEFDKPEWAGKEVTADKSYSNIRLSKENK